VAEVARKGGPCVGDMAWRMLRAPDIGAIQMGVDAVMRSTPTRVLLVCAA